MNGKYLSSAPGYRFRLALFEIMDTRGINQTEMSKVLGVDRNTIRRMFDFENKEYRVKRVYVEAAAKKFSINKCDFVKSDVVSGYGIKDHMVKIKRSTNTRTRRKHVSDMASNIDSYFLHRMRCKLASGCTYDLAGAPVTSWWVIGVGNDFYTVVIDYTRKHYIGFTSAKLEGEESIPSVYCAIHQYHFQGIPNRTFDQALSSLNIASGITNGPLLQSALSQLVNRIEAETPTELSKA